MRNSFVISWVSVAMLTLLFGCVSSRVNWDEVATKAKAGDAESQFGLGCRYDFGEGIPKDQSEAAKWYRLAAEKGHAAAQNNLGSLYQFGAGVAQDYTLAREWYEKSVALGYPMALNNLGYLYRFGLGVETNAQRAADLYKRAAEKGDPSAMVNLGIAYADGTGVTKDLIEAYKWLDLARFHTVSSSDMRLKWGCRKALDRVAARMSQEQMAEAEKRAREFDKRWRPSLFIPGR